MSWGERDWGGESVRDGTVMASGHRGASASHGVQEHAGLHHNAEDVATFAKSRGFHCIEDDGRICRRVLWDSHAFLMAKDCGILRALTRGIKGQSAIRRPDTEARAAGCKWTGVRHRMARQLPVVVFWGADEWQRIPQGVRGSRGPNNAESRPRAQISCDSDIAAKGSVCVRLRVCKLRSACKNRGAKPLAFLPNRLACAIPSPRG